MLNRQISQRFSCVFQTPPTTKRHTSVVKRNGSYGTLPKEMVVRNRDDDREHRRSRGFPSFGRALLRIKSTKRSCSAPNLGDGIKSSICLSHTVQNALLSMSCICIRYHCNWRNLSKLTWCLGPLTFFFFCYANKQHGLDRRRVYFNRCLFE